MESQMLRQENSQNVNHLLLDIRKYLQKLETGQMEIEASQWELHKDITNVRFSIEEMRKLKQDVEEMKLTNAEAMQLIRSLEKKLASHEAKLAEKTSDGSEAVEEEEKVYTVSDEEKSNSKDFKRRDCCKGLSEEIVEITSDIKPNESEKEEREFEIEEFCDNEREEAEREEYYSKNLPSQQSEEKSQSRQSRRRNHRTRKPDDTIMARYLKDSAKYHNWNPPKASNKKRGEYDSFCTSTTRPEPKHGMYWDDLQQKDNTFQSRTGKSLSMESFKCSRDPESILPGQFFCPKCLKNFAYKCEYIRHQIHEHPMSEKKFYCRNCRKFIVRQCKTSNRCCTRIAKTTKKSGAPPYNCSYCGKVTSSPEQLTAHIRKCRIISRTNLSENN